MGGVLGSLDNQHTQVYSFESLAQVGKKGSKSKSKSNGGKSKSKSNSNSNISCTSVTSKLGPSRTDSAVPTKTESVRSAKEDEEESLPSTSLSTRNAHLGPDGKRLRSKRDICAKNITALGFMQRKTSLQTLVDHRLCVTSLCALSDHMVASGSADQSIRIWNIRDDGSMQCVRVIKHNDCCYRIAAIHIPSSSSSSSPRSLIATAGFYGVVTIYDWHSSSASSLENYSQVLSFSTRPPAPPSAPSSPPDITPVEALVWAPSIRCFLITCGSNVQVWSWPSLHACVLPVCVATLEGHADNVESLCLIPFGPKSHPPASSSPFSLNIAVKMEIDTDVDAASDELWLASGAHNSTIRVWHLQRHHQQPQRSRRPKTNSKTSTNGSASFQARCHTILHGHRAAVYSLTALVPFRLLASGSGDHTIILWDPFTGQRLHTLFGHTSWVYSLSCLSDGRLVSGSFDSVVLVWDTHLLNLRRVSASPSASSSVSSSSSFQAPTTLLSSHDPSFIRVLDEHAGFVSALVCLQGHVVLTGAQDAAIKMWNIQSGGFGSPAVSMLRNDKEPSMIATPRDKRYSVIRELPNISIHHHQHHHHRPQWLATLQGFEAPVHLMCRLTFKQRVSSTLRSHNSKSYKGSLNSTNAMSAFVLQEHKEEKKSTEEDEDEDEGIWAVTVSHVPNQDAFWTLWDLKNDVSVLHVDCDPSVISITSPAPGIVVTGQAKGVVTVWELERQLGQGLPSSQGQPNNHGLHSPEAKGDSIQTQSVVLRQSRVLQLEASNLFEPACVQALLPLPYGSLAVASGAALQLLQYHDGQVLSAPLRFALPIANLVFLPSSSSSSPSLMVGLRPSDGPQGEISSAPSAIFGSAGSGSSTPPPPSPQVHALALVALYPLRVIHQFSLPVPSPFCLLSAPSSLSSACYLVTVDHVRGAFCLWDVWSASGRPMAVVSAPLLIQTSLASSSSSPSSFTPASSSPSDPSSASSPVVFITTWDRAKQGTGVTRLLTGHANGAMHVWTVVWLPSASSFSTSSFASASLLPSISHSSVLYGHAPSMRAVLTLPHTGHMLSTADDHVVKVWQ